MDHLSTKDRSLNMSKIRSKHTKPEMIVRSMLHRMGYRFRLHVKKLPGKPDIVLKKYNTIIFCNGCFWHQHPGCKKAAVPKTNQSYWLPKLNKNVTRYVDIVTELKEMGWYVTTIWECETKDPETLRQIINLYLKHNMHRKNIL
ncbi:MAG: DNA mismatch endonuclease Vsr [Chlorobium sp.]|nr:DNA mismatch endonuclease Vsr [Chlorobium sp.]